MELQQIHKSLLRLGHVLQAAGESRFSHLNEKQQAQAKRLETLISTAWQENPWFTENNVRYAYLAYAQMLQEDIELGDNTVLDFTQTIAVIPAGNAPLEGLKDISIALLSGFKVQIKLVHKKEKLLPEIIQLLQELTPGLKDLITTAKGKLDKFDQVIVTIPADKISEWHKYFSRYPGKIRTAKYGAAVINGKETLNELEALGNDMLRYFGRTFENVKKLYIPQEYSPNLMYESLEPYEKEMKHHTNYFNNYEYNKSIYILNQENFRDNGFLLFRESSSPESRIAVLHLERYRDANHLNELLERDTETRSLLISTEKNKLNTRKPGYAHQPSLSDEDAKDTFKQIKKALF